MTTWKSLRRKTGFSKQYKFHVNLLTSAELICKTSKFNKIPLVLMTSVVKIFHLNKMISALNQCFQGDFYWKLSKHFSCKLFYLKQLILYFFHGNSWRLKWIKDTLIIQAKKSTPNIDLISGIAVKSPLEAIKFILISEIIIAGQRMSEDVILNEKCRIYLKIPRTSKKFAYYFAFRKHLTEQQNNEMSKLITCLLKFCSL